jgi:hypothetical protein
MQHRLAGGAGGNMKYAAKLVLAVVAFAGLQVVGAAGQQAVGDGVAPAAPVPAAIFVAKKVFVSNAGADGGLFPHPFTGTQERGYNQFYMAMRSWGRYELVGDPQQADMVFELQLLGPNGPANANKVKGASDPLPMFRLNVMERKTHYSLWALTETIEAANLQKTHDRNFDEAIAQLVADLKGLLDTATSH